MKFPLPAFLFLSAVCAVCAGEPRIAYHETFPDYRDPAHYTRIALAARDWKILTGPDGSRFMRVTIAPKPGQPGALILWDLVPIQFNRFSVEVRLSGTDGAPVYLGSSAEDCRDASFSFKSYGETGAGAKRMPLPADGSWTRYEVAIPADLTKIQTRGKEVTPCRYGRGEALTSWEGVNFSNHGFTVLYFNVDVPPQSPLIGKTCTLDFRHLELRDTDSNPDTKP